MVSLTMPVSQSSQVDTKVGNQSCGKAIQYDCEMVHRVELEPTTRNLPLNFQSLHTKLPIGLECNQGSQLALL